MPTKAEMQTRIEQLEAENERLQEYQDDVKTFNDDVHNLKEVEDGRGLDAQSLTIYIRPGSKFRVHNVIFRAERVKRHGFTLKPVGRCVVLEGEPVQK